MQNAANLFLLRNTLETTDPFKIYRPRFQPEQLILFLHFQLKNMIQFSNRTFPYGYLVTTSPQLPTHAGEAYS